MIISSEFGNPTRLLPTFDESFVVVATVISDVVVDVVVLLAWASFFVEAMRVNRIETSLVMRGAEAAADAADAADADDAAEAADVDATTADAAAEKAVDVKRFLFAADVVDATDTPGVEMAGFDADAETAVVDAEAEMAVVDADAETADLDAYAETEDVDVTAESALAVDAVVVTVAAAATFPAVFGTKFLILKTSFRLSGLKETLSPDACRMRGAGEFDAEDGRNS